MSSSQTIGCKVHHCKHINDKENVCSLDEIRVSPCGNGSVKTPEAETACSMYTPHEK